MVNTYVEGFFPRADLANRTDEFSIRVRESQRRVFQIAYRLLANSADAEEVVQEVFLRAFRKFSTLRDPERFHIWVNRIAFRLALNLLRTYQRQRAREAAWYGSHGHAALDGAGNAEEIVFLNRLRGEIDRLPEKLRAVLLLCTIEGLEARHVAGILDIPVGTVRSRLHLARKRLLEALNP